MQETFTKEVSFYSQEINPESNNFESVLKKTTITFKELCRTDKTQAKLQWKITTLMSSSQEDGEEAVNKVDSDAVYDLTVKFMKQMPILNENFNEQDRLSFLNDNGAMLQLGLWLLGEKFKPFFLNLMSN